MVLCKLSVFIIAMTATLFAAYEAHAQKRPSKAEFMFRYVDEDADGRLSPEEFQLILTPAAAHASYSVRHQGIPPEFLSADQNKDGFVQLDELILWLNAAN